MKKLLLICISFFLSLMVVTASANSFSIRNGITFGMDVDEVEKIEKQNGLADGKNNRNEYPEWPIAGLTYVNRNLLGFDDVTLTYLFQKSSNEIFSIKYSGYYKKRRSDVFDSLNGLLIEKYGSPSYTNKNETLPPFLTDGFVQAIESYQFDADPVHGSKANELKWDGWLIEYEDYYVDISLFYRYSKDTFSIERTSFELQYTMRTKEEVNEKLQELNERNQSVKDSI